MGSRLLSINGGKFSIRVHDRGEGPDLFYLHGAGGLLKDDPFIAALSTRYHVYAPLLPGFEDSDGDVNLREMLDFSLLGFDIMDALGLARPLVVGHSMGGMIAAEMAAIAPNEVQRLALICPAGLWIDESPIVDLFALLPFELPPLLFHDPEKFGALLSAGGNLNDPEFLTGFVVENSRRMTTAGKILFPIPDRGLRDRLYRVKARTQIIWGADDKLIPKVYAHAFAKLLPGAETTLIPNTGHMVIYEDTNAVLSALSRLHN